MNLTETKLKGSFAIDIKRIEDDRGFFARAWCQHELEAAGLNSSIVQMNIGFNKRRGTVRGMHYQDAPRAEAKLVRCTMGAVYDVIVDLRPGSPTFKQWVGMELSQTNRTMLYVPEGFAHGYQALQDDSEIYYLTTQFYAPEFATGVRFDDPAFRIIWPLEVTVISNQDKSWSDYLTQEERQSDH